MASAGKNADKSREYRTKDDVYNPYGGTTTPTTTDDKPGNTGNNSGGDGTTNDMTQAKLEAALPGVGPQLIESFKEKGYVFDFKNGTLVTPNGTKLSGNDFNDPSKLDSAFGVSPGSVQAALAKEHEAMSKGGDGTGTGTGTAAGGLNAGLKGSSGFGGSAYLATSGALGNGILQGDSYGDMGDGYSSLGSSKKLKNGEANLNGLRNPAFDDKIGTLTKIYNGDKIGAESENIFMMLHKQYNTQKTQDKFLSNK